jgi:hypothetical protein
LIEASGQTTRVRFLPNANFNGQVRLYYRAWDRTQGAPGGTFNLAGNYGGSKAFSTAFEFATLSVLPVNDAPVLTANTSPLGYTRDSSPGVLFMQSTATVKDVDSPNFDTGQLTVSFTSGAHAGNRLEIAGSFSFAGDDVMFFSTKIGTRNTDGGQGTNLVITFNANATRDLVERLVRTLRFRTENGTAGQRVIAVQVSDGDGKVSNVVSRTVNVS